MNKEKRLDFCKKCLDDRETVVETFDNVIFTDESSVQLESYRKVQYVKRKVLPALLFFSSLYTSVSILATLPPSHPLEAYTPVLHRTM